MKKIITKFWGVALIVVLLSSFFVAAAPVSAADPLNWESKLDTPSTLFAGLLPGGTIIDYAVSQDGMKLYAITRGVALGGAASANVTTTFVEGPPLDDDTFTVTYVNEVGAAGRTATVTVTGNSTAGTTATLALQAGDTSIADVTGIADGTSDATAGVIGVWNGATLLGSYNAGTNAFTDGTAMTVADTLYQATTGGGMWTNITARLGGILGNLDYVAMAPDDPNVIVVADATPATLADAMISVDGGTLWSSMGNIQSGAATAATGIRGIAIAPVVTGGIRYIAAYGTAGANDPGLFYYNFGAGVGGWRDATDAAATDFTAGPIASAGVGTYDSVVAFAFSPNFPSDYMAAAILQEDTPAAGDITDFHILSFNSRSWDTAIAAQYPVLEYTSIGALTINSADIALVPDYDGADESLRIAFVAMAWTDAGAGTDDGGIFRHIDNAPASRIFGSTTSSTAVNSVVHDGTTLIAGLYDSNLVYRSADPMVTSPTFLPARNLKRIGIDDANNNDMVNLQLAGETLFGSKRGIAGGLSKSLDFGNTWNDYTLLNTALTNIDDIYFAAAGDPWYLSARDATTSTVFRMSMFAMTRVLVVAGNSDFLLRGTPEDGAVIYAADEGGTVLYYSADGGLQRWFQRNNVPAAIADVAVESQQTIYVGSGVNVYKSTNAGFTWGPPVNSRLAGLNTAINSMVSLGENNLLVGGNAGGVVWSTDGGATWFASMGVLTGGSFTPVLVAATGLAQGDYVFAAEEGTDAVFRCEISPANFLGEFKTMNLTDAIVGNTNVGIAYTNGVLYTLSTVAGGAVINRTLAPTIPVTHAAIFWSTPYQEAGIVPATPPLSVNDLDTSAGAPGSIMLYAIAPGPFGASVYYFDDTLALNGPVLTGPADDLLVQVVSPLTGAVQAVQFSWNRISLATQYTLSIALDEAFTAPVTLTNAGVAVNPVVSSANPVSVIVQGTNFQPGATYYWRVRANVPTTSAWSETRSFTVQPTAASVPVISSPTIGQSIDNTSPAFSWSPVSGATMYRFELSEGISFADPVYAVDTPVAGAQLPADMQLERGTQYFWRVKALSPVESDFSTVGNFVVAEEETTAPPPAVTTTIITVPPPPAGTTTVVTIPPAVTEEVNPAYIWAIIIIGAVLVIAVIVLIVRTRRSV